MARSEYEPYADVTPRLDPFGGEIAVQPSAGDFGGGIAQGAEALGQGLNEQVHFYSQVAANDATNNTIDQITKALYGDPSQTTAGPDGQSSSDVGYMGLKGADAMRARQPTSDRIDEIIAENRGSLRTPLAQNQYDNDTRRMRQQWLAKMGEHADQQQQAWTLDTYSTQGQLALNEIGRDPSDASLAQIGASPMDVPPGSALGRLRQAYVRIAQARGEDPSGAVLKADQSAAEQQGRGLIMTDPLSAPKVLQSHMDVLGGLPDAYRLMQEAKQSAEDRLTGIWSDPDRVHGGTPASQLAPGSVDGLKTAIRGQESGNNPAVHMSDKGAVGIGQIMPPTFAEFARPGEDIHSPTDNAAVSGRIIDHYAQVYHGDAQRVAVAYFSGPGNVAPPGSPTPWKHDASDGHVKTSQYVADVTRRMGEAGATSGGGGGADEDTYLAQVREAARGVFPNDPNAVENVVKRVQFNVHRDDSAAVAAVEGQAKDTIAYLENGGDPAKAGLTPDQIRAKVPGPRGEAIASGLETATDYAHAAKQISTASEAQVRQILESHTPQGPENFQQRAGEFDALYKAAVERQKAIYGTKTQAGDPAAYVTSVMPDVGNALTAAFAKGAQPAQFDTYVKAVQGAYGALGIAPAAQRLLPQGYVRTIVGNLETKAPSEALGMLAGVQREAGQHWSQVYGELVRGGLPVGYQTALVVAGSSPSDGQVIAEAMQKDADATRNGRDPMEKQAEGLTVGGKKVTALIDRALSDDRGLGNLRATFGVAGKAGVDQFTGVQDAVRRTALYLYLSGAAHDPNAAAQRAAKMVTGIYAFVQQPGHVPARIPKGMTDDFAVATGMRLRNLKETDVQPYAGETTQGGETIHVPPAEAAQHALRGAQHAYWVTIPGVDGEGAARAMDPQTGRPVLLRGGRTLDIPFAAMKTMAQGAWQNDPVGALGF